MKSCKTLWFVLPVLPLVLVSCRGAGEDRSKTVGEKQYEVRGKVVTLNPVKPAVTLDHEDIPGLMKAMQMEFGVEDPKLLEGIQIGDQVQGRLKKGESGYVLTQLEKRTGQ